MKANLIEAFGEEKTIHDWAKDERCIVTYNMLRQRLKRKENPELAMTTKPLKTVPGRDVKIGDKLHSLTIKEFKTVHEHGQNKTFVYCQCDCGEFTTTKLAGVLDGNTKSCGCLQVEVQRELAIERNYKHGKGNLDYRLYKEWCNMKARCCTSSATQFKDWGGRGITVCEEWKNDFEVFEKWALNNGYRDDLTIERVDVNGNYNADNCKWIPLAEQQLNRRDSVLITAWGETKNLVVWGRDPRCNIDYRMIRYRIDHGWSTEEAISKPPQ